jgi:nitroreductase
MESNAYESLVSRRSIRQYENRPVPKELVRKLLEAAMCAPSARHQEPWHFVVIDDRKTLEEISCVHPHAKMAASAPLAVLVCGEPALETAKGYCPVDCGNAALNLLQAAHALGLGGVWVGIYPRVERMAEMRRILSIPEGIIPFAFLPIGYPAESKGRENRYKGERVHNNKW